MTDQSEHTTRIVQVESNGFGTAAMVCGIVGLVLSIIPILGLVSWALAPLAIIFGFIGLSKKGMPRGQAIAGVATGSVAMVICLLWLALMVASAASHKDRRERMNRTNIDMPIARPGPTI